MILINPCQRWQKACRFDFGGGAVREERHQTKREEDGSNRQRNILVVASSVSLGRIAGRARLDYHRHRVGSRLLPPPPSRPTTRCVFNIRCLMPPCPRFLSLKQHLFSNGNEMPTQKQAHVYKYIVYTRGFSQKSPKYI